MTKRSLLWSLAVLITAAAVVLILVARKDTTAPALGATAERVEASDAAGVALTPDAAAAGQARAAQQSSNSAPLRMRPGVSSAPAAPSSALVTLPPIGANLTSIMSELDAHAAAGHRQAAIRAMRETRCCTRYEMALRTVDNVKRMVEQRGQSKHPIPPGGYDPTNVLAVNEKILLDLHPRCEGLNATAEAAFDRALRAAQLGDVDAMLDFAYGQHLAMLNKPIANAERLQQYRQWTPVFLERAVAAGSLDAVRLLGNVHANPEVHHWMGQLFEQDWYTAAVYDFLYVRAGGRMYRARYETFLSRMRKQLDAERLTQAEQQAARLHERYFASTPARETGFPPSAQMPIDQGTTLAPDWIEKVDACR